MGALLGVALLTFSVPAWALTAQEIVNSVIDELNNVNDYTASVDVDFATTFSDMTDGTIQWKRSGSTFKQKMVQGSPYDRTYVTDGSNWNIEVENDKTLYMPLADGLTYVRFNSAADLFNMERVLGTETWTKDASTYTVNSVSCYRIYTTKANTNYQVWIDVATVKKVIKVKATDESNNLQWELDYNSYSSVESTAQLPAQIVTKAYEDGGVILTATYDFSSVNINESLSDSIFSISAP
ncbi:MAG: DUF4292 domain-containing protein [Candidatus Hydrogenedentes bacterium]|nr:DUF4292 domain-containing protein [Candidatus Hydrogenedentota bacterium]